MKKNITTPTNVTGKRKHGFRRKMSSRGGRNVISRRRKKGRHELCP